jgi:TonB dependent receptor.
MANQDITWEKTDQWNVGVDAAFWSNKLTLGADWFRKETRDILLQLPVPNMMGVSAPMQNAGVVRNTGIELTTRDITTVSMIGAILSEPISAM